LLLFVPEARHVIPLALIAAADACGNNGFEMRRLTMRCGLRLQALLVTSSSDGGNGEKPGLHEETRLNT
jgi:hypothetical protein